MLDQLSISVTKENDEVLYSSESVTKVTQKDIGILKLLAKKNTTKKIRLCAHNSKNDLLHDMIIIHSKDTYVRPHKHLMKDESMHVLDGIMEVVVFDENGTIEDVFQMGNYSSYKPFFYRMPRNTMHTVIVKLDTVVFAESTVGPFNRNETQFADWAPINTDYKGRTIFLNNLRKGIENFLSDKKFGN